MKPSTDSRLRLRLTPGQIVLGVSWLVHLAAVSAVVVWRVGAVERRLDMLDDRIWQLRGGATVAASVPAIPRPTPRDAARTVIANPPARDHAIVPDFDRILP